MFDFIKKYNSKKENIRLKTNQILEYKYALDQLNCLVNDDMCHWADKVKIIEAHSEEELSREYSLFKSKLSTVGKIGNVQMLNNSSNFKKEGNKYICFIEHKEYCLKENYTLDQYREARKDIYDLEDKIKNAILELNKLDPYNRFRGERIY